MGSLPDDLETQSLSVDMKQPLNYQYSESVVDVDDHEKMQKLQDECLQIKEHLKVCENNDKARDFIDHVFE